MSSPYQQIPSDKIVPNEWNPNKLHPDLLGKLENGIRATLEQAGSIPPIVVRPHPSRKGHYEIIDGFHRWTVLKKIGREEIGAFVLPVDDSMARVLTSTLNYIRGEADPDKYPMLVAEAIKANPDLRLEDLAKLLPETEDQLLELVESSESALATLQEVVEKRAEQSAEEGSVIEEDPDRWTTLSFTVPLAVANIVEQELDRIAGYLTGKMRRMRALEYMAVNSALTPLDTVESQIKLKEKQRERKEAVVKVRDAGFKSDVKEEAAAPEKKSVSKKPTAPPKKAKK